MRLCSYQPDIAPNLGSMIRLCACLGVPLDVIEPCGFPLSVKALKRSAMDYADIADITRHNSWQNYRTLKKNRRIVLLTTKGADVLWDFEFRPDDVLMMGRESAGVPDDVHAAVDARVYIPLSPNTRSMNVAVTAGISIAEALRQTRYSK